MALGVLGSGGWTHWVAGYQSALSPECGPSLSPSLGGVATSPLRASVPLGASRVRPGARAPVSRLWGSARKGPDLPWVTVLCA